ncbi:hypothetical protein O181_024070 [Austropuccinia psidii MF-1]|uniref:Uncharacterized protein n=1 Tax=Austropuccinia psidii MF-1 TaxID=1389203 RepID=A0A9Q3CJU8_9BASI|nr:hypothetical protein [Austropuccinia psidii MF-1]
MGWFISHQELWCFVLLDKLEKRSIDQAKLFKSKETEETENSSSKRMKKIFLGPNKIPFSAIFDAKNGMNVMNQEIALRAELNISPYTSKTTDSPLHLIGQIKALHLTFGIFTAPYRKSQGNDPEKIQLEVEDSQEIAKVKEELKNMKRNLDMAIEDPDKWLALELSGKNEMDGKESKQKKPKMDLKPPEVNSSGFSEDYFNIFQEDTG